MAKQLRNLAGKVVAITGGGRGIGLATAKALAGQGGRVAIGDVDLAAASEAAAGLGPGAVALPLDVTERDSFTAFFDAIEEQLGAVDVLVNNAGIMPVGRFIDEDDVTTRRMVDINLHGVLLGMKLALERMVARDQGHIVNIASQAGKFGAPGGATYSATKHAVVGVSEAVRGELRLMGSNVALSYVMPFVVNTELGSGLGEARGLKTLQPGDVAEAIVEALQTGRVEVWVPRSTKRTYTFSQLLPRPLREGLGRAMKADRVLASADATARRSYELRAARSQPALSPGETATSQVGEGAG